MEYNLQKQQQNINSTLESKQFILMELHSILFPYRSSKTSLLRSAPNSSIVIQCKYLNENRTVKLITQLSIRKLCTPNHTIKSLQFLANKNRTKVARDYSGMDFTNVRSLSCVVQICSQFWTVANKRWFRE